jgi:hypothetical protein
MPRRTIGRGARYGLGARPGLVTGTVDQELLARNEYLAAENGRRGDVPADYIAVPMKTYNGLVVGLVAANLSTLLIGNGWRGVPSVTVSKAPRPSTTPDLGDCWPL